MTKRRSPINPPLPSDLSFAFRESDATDLILRRGNLYAYRRGRARWMVWRTSALSPHGGYWTTPHADEMARFNEVAAAARTTTDNRS